MMKALFLPRIPIGLLLIFLMVSGCELSSKKLFTSLSPQQTGVAFANTLEERVDLNILNYLYFFNGGGVAAGDINNDGLADLYFTSNQQPNRLYLNKGNFQFEDITEQAGVAGQSGWTTGVSMADVNGDGWLDIYVCQVGDYEGVQGKNQLYLNQGDLSFKEVAAAYGLDFTGFSTQSCWLDYDRDGDLDMYLLNHSVHDNDTYRDTAIRRISHPTAGDRFFRNDGDHFTDVTAQAGVYSSAVGYGLGIVASDINLDGWPDLYIGNDFHENDYLYVNNGDGTFTERLEELIGHTSRFSMGVDVGDINNDARPDILSLDMKPEREDILKTSEGPEEYQIFQFKRSYGYNAQYPRNALQLNRGVGRFSEISQYAGVDATDWSWAVLFADFDLDGFQDIFISNGIYRRPNDMDYIKFISDQEVIRAINNGLDEEDLKFILKMPQVPISNYAFRNQGDLTFGNASQGWGLDRPGFSQGAVYADLDNDGDLDLVVNNLNEVASLYRNEAKTDSRGHYLRVRLEGTGRNSFGVGTKVILQQQGSHLYREQFASRGFQSSVEPVLHFGLGTSEQIDTLTVIWPDGHMQVLTDVPANQTLTLRQQDAGEAREYPFAASPELLRSESGKALGINFRHRENRFNDFGREPLMLQMLSTQGPALAVGDVNGDALEDLFAGGARGQTGMLFIQDQTGRFAPANSQPWARDSLREDVDARFFDADGDGDLDLYVVHGGNEWTGAAFTLLDQLYLNDGRGNFEEAVGHLPVFYAQGACVREADFDGDGDLDLFVGSRSVAFQYGKTPQSYLLENDGLGHFSLASEEKMGGLGQAGMVCDAAWADIDGDRNPDLMVVGDWMPLRVFQNQGGKLSEITDAAGLGKSNGWWNCLQATDLDGDGDVDLVAGNLGLNSVIKASPQAPAQLYLNDFDGNGSLDPILCYYKGGESYPFPSRDALLNQLTPLRKRFVNYRDYASAKIEDIFPPELLAQAEVKTAYSFASSWIENDGKGNFVLHQLPAEAQFAPMMCALTTDMNGDGHTDILLAGNFFDVGPNIGQADADLGVWLEGDGKGNFSSLPPYRTGLVLQGQARKMETLSIADGGRYLIVATNNGPLQIWAMGQLVD